MTQEEFLKESIKNLYSKGISLKEIENILGVVLIYDGYLTEEKIECGNYNLKMILHD